MSKNINVNPGQYKVAGRERQGESVPHDRERQRLSLSKGSSTRVTPPTAAVDRSRAVAGKDSVRPARRRGRG
jgi:hypothetical protein